ncbi:pyruvate kinase [Angulomicrobium tetraedrale]|uniref:Pyruvate kinase n=1 Tax=Ancylobacter tetraedralis TaxID=217068 RepID=A0A839ZC14_9HYPH|nr:pyruvate kinase [Ancylobacter tetraedralis]MBB3772248.1 pyruvate kinase [Ancylobacter tetraedralis]
MNVQDLAPSFTLPAGELDDAALLDAVLALRAAVLKGAAPLAARFAAAAEREEPALVNLAHYLSLRHHDLRDLQRQLMRRGLSSLGRLESRVLPTLDAVIAALATLAGRPAPFPAPDGATFFAGEARLDGASATSFGPEPADRYTRIMVTLPSEAAGDPDYVMNLARHGMDVARINCAHDDAEAWRAMAAHVRAAGAALGRPITVLMDIAGPKIRTGAVLPVSKKGKPSGKLMTGDLVRLVAEGAPRTGSGVDFAAAVSLPEIVTRLRVGDRVLYDDGKVSGVVESVGDGEAVIRIVHARAQGTKLKPEKGINLPDTPLGLSPLTAKDDADLATVLECADMLGYSFVSRAQDLDLLDAAIARHGRNDREGRPLGLMAKIERPEAVRNLPDLIARAARSGPFSVMIARGDLAAEIGFERLAEMQEELLWICEAAAVPAIWATQVLEDLVRDGIPSRGEMTDAAMAARAECVMLNKGPAVIEAIDLLDRLLGRMAGHLDKKTPTLRALKSW